MKLTSNEETLAESKALILYILNSINKPITNNALYKIILSVLDMNYFYFQQFLLDLENNEYIINYQKENDILYEITEKGKSTLELTIDVLPGIIKLKVDENIKGELQEIKNESAVRAEFIPLSEKEFIVKCKIIENSITIFEIQAFANSRDQAIKIVQNWEANAGTIYPKVLQMLNE